jgi:hypothetical protein
MHVAQKHEKMSGVLIVKMLHAPVIMEFQRSQIFWAKFFVLESGFYGLFLIHSQFIDIVIFHV